MRGATSAALKMGKGEIHRERFCWVGKRKQRSCCNSRAGWNLNFPRGKEGRKMGRATSDAFKMGKIKVTAKSFAGLKGKTQRAGARTARLFLLLFLRYRET